MSSSRLNNHLGSNPESCEPGCLVSPATSGGFFVLEVCTYACLLQVTVCEGVPYPIIVLQHCMCIRMYPVVHVLYNIF